MLLDQVQDAVTTKQIDFREVGLREGMQSTGMILPTKTKIEYFGRLKDAGVKEMNVCSFMHPVTMPQMADAEIFLRNLGELREGVVLSGVVPNEKGMDRAIAMREEGLLDLAFVIFAESESTLAANRMTSSHEALLAQIEREAARAKAAGLDVSVFLSNAYGCSIEGRIDQAKVVEHAAQLWSFDGVGEIIISDSVGQADPLQVLRMLTALSEVLPVDRRLCVHLHDTRGAGLANVFAALCSPFKHLVIDAAFGGWGGDYPFVPEAFGNVASEDLLEMLLGMGFDHGVDVAEIMAVTRDYADISLREIPAKLKDATPVAWKRELLGAGA